jgi:hypothetical protein
MENEDITRGQILAARALTEISQARLAERAQVDLSALVALERGHAADDTGRIAARVRKALEELGAVFIPERLGAGAGVRLKFGRGQSRAIGRWENEGGLPADDEVP